MKIETIQTIKGLLLSDRLVYKGNEIPLLIALVAELDAEESRLRDAALPPPPPSPSPPPSSEPV